MSARPPLRLLNTERCERIAQHVRARLVSVPLVIARIEGRRSPLLDELLLMLSGRIACMLDEHTGAVRWLVWQSGAWNAARPADLDELLEPIGVRWVKRALELKKKGCRTLAREMLRGGRALRKRGAYSRPMLALRGELLVDETLLPAAAVERSTITCDAVVRADVAAHYEQMNPSPRESLPDGSREALVEQLIWALAGSLAYCNKQTEHSRAGLGWWVHRSGRWCKADRSDIQEAMAPVVARCLEHSKALLASGHVQRAKQLDRFARVLFRRGTGSRAMTEARGALAVPSSLLIGRRAADEMIKGGAA